MGDQGIIGRIRLTSALAVFGFGGIVTPAGAVAEPPSAPAPRVEILADTNRDGVVTEADREGKTSWTNGRGAILLPNIGDSTGCCPGSDAQDHTDAQLEACHDAQDDIPRAPENFAPVRTMPVAGLTQGAFGSVAAIGPGAGKVRVFVLRNGSWKYLGPRDRLSFTELSEGARLGVDTRDVVRDASRWNGQVMLQFTVSEGGRETSDRVAMRVAPVVVHNHTEKASAVYAPLSGGNPAHQAFVTDLADALDRAEFKGAVLRFNTQDNWAQDFVEFGYVSMPRPNGEAAVIRVAIRSPQPTRAAGRALFDLRAPGMGVIQIGGDHYHQGDSFGNLETVPPYELNGRRYPAGRLIIGDAGDGYAPHSDMIRFFEAQAQAPIILDASWLIIAHVDEFVQFLPADNPRGWTIGITDVRSALAVLRRAQRDGHGHLPAFSRDHAPQVTIDELLSDKEFLEDNELARRKIDQNLARLLAETGVREDEVVRVPGLFHQADFARYTLKARERENTDYTPPPPGEGPPERIVYGPGEMIAYYPAAVNGLLLDRTNYVSSKQWGPVVNGVDVMQQAVQEAYAKVGIRVWSIDDWLSHHVVGGNVHCGTNVTRQIGSAWWK